MLLQLDLFACQLFASLAVEDVVEIIVETTLVPPGFVLELHLHSHCLVKSLFVLTSLLGIEELKDVDLAKA